LILLFALSPFIQTMINVSTMPLSAGVPHFFYWYDSGLRTAAILSLAGLFLLQKRSLRWLAFLFGVVTCSLVACYTFWPNAPLTVLSTAVCLAIIIIGWLDGHTRKQFIPIS
jgi:hypothetical protein